MYLLFVAIIEWTFILHLMKTGIIIWNYLRYYLFHNTLLNRRFMVSCCVSSRLEPISLKTCIFTFWQTRSCYILQDKTFQSAWIASLSVNLVIICKNTRQKDRKSTRYEAFHHQLRKNRLPCFSAGIPRNIVF